MEPTIDPESKRILIVDDDDGVLELLTDILTDELYRTSFAVSGEDALQKARNVEPDLMLLDVDLPDRDGFEVSRLLREDESLDEIPVLFMTAYSSRHGIDKAFENDGFDYVTKPIQKKELLARVQHVLELNSYRSELESKVRKRTEELKEKNESLQRANQALEEVLDRVEAREEKTWKKISREIENLVEPHLEKLQLNVREDLKEQVRLIQQNLDDIFEGKAEEFSDLRDKLTPREFEVSSYIRQGLTSKEIASTLGRSVSTVKNHRRSIREKLDLTNKDVSLKQYLQKNF